jgi:methylated-DNA-[protein]-cysteine S-methyltransferase
VIDPQTLPTGAAVVSVPVDLALPGGATTGFGDLHVVADHGALTHILLPNSPAPAPRRSADSATNAVAELAAEQLRDYFAGVRTDFDLPLDPTGTTFQRRVWFALADIAYGQTASYAQVAAAVGHPTGTRAVGAANGRNPLSIVLPCHRVIGSDGSLTGYGGGLPLKRALLALEQGDRQQSLFDR